MLRVVGLFGFNNKGIFIFVVENVNMVNIGSWICG